MITFGTKELHEFLHTPHTHTKNARNNKGGGVCGSVAGEENMSQMDSKRFAKEEGGDDMYSNGIETICKGASGVEGIYNNNNNIKRTKRK